jgi:hypothetical protein
MLEDCDVYVGKPCRLRAALGCFVLTCPFPVLEAIPAMSMAVYAAHAQAQARDSPGFRTALLACKGKRLGCWCVDTSRCHAVVLAALVNSGNF